MAVTVLFLLVWGGRGRFSRGATAVALAVCLGTFAATRALHRTLVATLWVTSPGSLEANLFGRLLDPATWIGVLPLRAAGQLWYLLAATLGLFALGAWELGRRAARRRRTEDREAGADDAAGAEAARVVLLAMAVVFAASIAVMIPAKRADHFLYGRYNEALLGPFLVAGVAAIATGSRRTVLAQWGGAAGLCALLGAALQHLLPAEGLARSPMVLNVLGVLVWNPSPGLLHSTPWAMVGTVVLALLALASRRAAVLALAAFFAVSAVLVEQRQLLPVCRYWRGLFTLQETLRPLAPAALSYERSGLPTTYGFNVYQFWLDRTRFRLFDAAAGEAPSEDLVIASQRWSPRPPGFRKVASETSVDQALWVAPGPLQTELERRGLLLPAASTAPLPPEALRSRIERLDGTGTIVARPGDAPRLRFRLAHAGHGGIWVPITLADSPWGSVRLAARWFRAGAALPIDPGGFRGELPRVLRPGDAAEVEITVPVRDAAGQPLEPGSYELEIGPVQEGVRWFVDAGDHPLLIPVKIRR